MSDYKNTLNLPATDFPMKANLANREGGFLKEWHDQDLNQQIRNKFKGNPLFVLHDCLLYTSPSPRDRSLSRMPSSA